MFAWLLVFVPITLVAQALGFSEVTLFVCAAIAIIPLAKYIGEATEELSSRTTPAVGGLLNATLGNLPELLIGIFALQAGLLTLVKASITGSIVGNLLFVLGLAMFVGGWGRDKQQFNRTGVVAAGSTLFVGAIALIVPAVFSATQMGTPIPATSVGHLSVFVSGALMVIYAGTLLFSLRTHRHLYVAEVSKYEPRWSVKKSLLILTAAALAVAWMSQILVGAVKPVVASWGVSELFLGVVFVAIIGNAAEHFSAVVVARKNRMDLSLQIAIGSATQVAMFAAPLLVLLSYILGHPMTLLFDTFELVSIVLSVIIVNLVVADGESNWLEGLQLLCAYAIVALAFFFHP